MDTQVQRQIAIVYPCGSSDFHRHLARRLAAACEEKSRGAILYSSAEVCNMDAGYLAGQTTLVINPWQCTYGIGPADRFFSRLSAARKRIVVLAEAVETRWFERQFEMPLQHNMVVDVGFVAQEAKLRGSSIPYRFLFNGPTRQEERSVLRADPSQRTIPWTFVGHLRDRRIRLAARLVEELDSGGFVFMPKGGQVREGEGTIGPLGLASVLSKTRYYVWNSQHEFEYYESLRFVEAVLAGAVPCKIDNEVTWAEHGIPGIFRSVGELADTVRNEGYLSMFETARNYFLSRGSLSDHLERILGDV